MKLASPYSPLDSAALMERATKALNAIVDPTPPFVREVGWARDYDSLFRDEFDAVTGIESILERAFRTGKVILSGHGGAGKTVTLRRLARLALKQSIITVICDLSRWTKPHYGVWADMQGSVIDRVDLLTNEFGTPPTPALSLQLLTPNTRKLLVIDGLNEISSTVGQELIATLEVFLHGQIQTATIIADRLVRREMDPLSTWQYAALRPLTEQQVREYLAVNAGPKESAPLGRASGLLSTPFFLDAHLHGEPLLGGAATLRAYLEHHAGLSPEDLEVVTRAAFNVYQSGRTRSFQAADFVAIAGNLITEKLQNAGVLVVTNDKAHFAHHLQHDYLAAAYVAAHPGNWTSDNFNIISLDASSFDALTFVVEQLSPDNTDAFIRQVYDWNPYAAAYAVSEARVRGSQSASRELELVILSMVAERRWDLMRHSAQRATDALSVSRSPEASELLKRASLNEVFDHVARQSSEKPWVQMWQELFTKPDGGSATDGEMRYLFDLDSIVGWTIANVLKRLRLTDTQLEELRTRFAIANATVRWRIVHVIGAFPSPSNVSLLLDALKNDPESWVRYGSVRSLVELAARADADLRTKAFQAIADDPTLLLMEDKLLREFERAVLIDPNRAPEDWTEQVAKVLEALRAFTPGSEQQSKWSSIAYQLRRDYVR